MNAGEIECLFSKVENELVKPKLAEHASPQGGAVVNVSLLLWEAEEGKQRECEGGEMYLYLLASFYFPNSENFSSPFQPT